MLGVRRRRYEELGGGRKKWEEEIGRRYEEV